MVFPMGFSQKKLGATDEAKAVGATNWAPEAAPGCLRQRLAAITWLWWKGCNKNDAMVIDGNSNDDNNSGNNNIFHNYIINIVADIIIIIMIIICWSWWWWWWWWWWWYNVEYIYMIYAISYMDNSLWFPYLISNGYMDISIIVYS